MKATALQPAQMLANHRAARKPRAARSASPAPRRRNVATVFALGDEEFIQFRGRAYGVPPVPLDEGEVLLELYLGAIGAAREMALEAMEMQHNPETRARYFAALKEMPALLWQLCRPVGRWRRLARRLGLHANPFKHGTEGELLELAAFFYARRTKSRGPVRPQIANPGRPISSMTS